MAEGAGSWPRRQDEEKLQDSQAGRARSQCSVDRREKGNEGLTSQSCFGAPVEAWARGRGTGYNKVGTGGVNLGCSASVHRGAPEAVPSCCT